MATIMSHSLVGATLSLLAPLPKKTKSFIFWMCFLPILPDFDFIGFHYGVAYGSFWGHRGFTHSILFSALAAVAALIATKNPQNRKAFFLLYFAAIFSHPVLDAFTNGGLGVAFFSPYNLARYFFPWRPIEVSPMGARFFSERGLVVMISEFFWIWIPCAVLALIKCKFFLQNFLTKAQ